VLLPRLLLGLEREETAAQEVHPLAERLGLAFDEVVQDRAGLVVAARRAVRKALPIAHTRILHLAQKLRDERLIGGRAAEATPTPVRCRRRSEAPCDFSSRLMSVVTVPLYAGHSSQLIPQYPSIAPPWSLFSSHPTSAVSAARSRSGPWRRRPFATERQEPCVQQVHPFGQLCRPP